MFRKYRPATSTVTWTIISATQITLIHDAASDIHVSALLTLFIAACILWNERRAARDPGRARRSPHMP